LIGRYVFDTQRLELRLGPQRQQLTEKEAALISFLYGNRNRLLKRAEVLEAVWGSDDFFSGRSMDVFFSRLRKYFAEDPGIAVETIRNIGLEFKVATDL
jgi:DNA-binding response OmpR family regulator